MAVNVATLEVTVGMPDLRPDDVALLRDLAAEAWDPERRAALDDLADRCARMLLVAEWRPAPEGG